MARGEVSSEENTEVESSATPSHDDIDNDDSSDKDSRARSGQRGACLEEGSERCGRGAQCIRGSEAIKHKAEFSSSLGAGRS